MIATDRIGHAERSPNPGRTSDVLSTPCNSQKFINSAGAQKRRTQNKTKETPIIKEIHNLGELKDKMADRRVDSFRLNMFVRWQRTSMAVVFHKAGQHQHNRTSMKDGIPCLSGPWESTVFLAGITSLPRVVIFSKGICSKRLHAHYDWGQAGTGYPFVCLWSVENVNTQSRTTPSTVVHVRGGEYS